MTKLAFSLVVVLLSCLINHGKAATAGSSSEEDIEVRPYSKRTDTPVPQNTNFIKGTVECYTCTACPKVEYNTTRKLCAYSADASKLNTCLVYTLQHKEIDHPWINRGCASERGSCEEITNTYPGTGSVALLSCHECTGDRCNVNNGVSSSDFSLTVLSLVLSPMLLKNTML